MRFATLFATAAVAAAQAGPVLVLNTCLANATKFQQYTYGKAGSNSQAIFLTATASNPMCFDIEGFDTNPGATVYTWPCGSNGAGANEVWSISGSQIKSGQSTPTCLCAAGTTPFVEVTTCKCDPTDPAQGLLYDAASGLIKHTASGLCVDAGSPAPPYCGALPHSSWTICDPTAPIDARAADIVSRMSLADKIQALDTGTPPLPSVGLPAYQWWSEATHGISGPGVSHSDALPGASNTALPITTSCSFNRTMWKATGNLIGREGRAYMNANLAGSTFWTPVINIVRDPR
jgi:Ricin-type beta-trefoil lectin domain